MSMVVSILLVLLAMAVGVVSLVGMFRPLPQLQLPTRKRAALALGGAFLLYILGAALAHRAPSPEELEKWKAKAAEREHGLQ